jgi:hypothetical protein
MSRTRELNNQFRGSTLPQSALGPHFDGVDTIKLRDTAKRSFLAPRRFRVLYRGKALPNEN